VRLSSSQIDLRIGHLQPDLRFNNRFEISVTTQSEHWDLRFLCER